MTVFALTPAIAADSHVSQNSRLFQDTEALWLILACMVGYVLACQAGRIQEDHRIDHEGSSPPWGQEWGWGTGKTPPAGVELSIAFSQHFRRLSFAKNAQESSHRGRLKVCQSLGSPFSGCNRRMMVQQAITCLDPTWLLAFPQLQSTYPPDR